MPHSHPPPMPCHIPLPRPLSVSSSPLRTKSNPLVPRSPHLCLQRLPMPPPAAAAPPLAAALPPPLRPRSTLLPAGAGITWRRGSIEKGEEYLARCRSSHALPKSGAPEHSRGLVQSALPVLELEDEEEEEKQGLFEINGGTRGVWRMVDEVRAMLKSMGDGEISISAYDTAWVALVKDRRGGRAQFPSALRWIVDNQLGDGSWGDGAIFSAHDRMLCTLACAIALESWRVHPEKREKGVAFVRDNLWRLGEEEAEHMPIGFEVAFPSLMDAAEALGLDLPYHHPALQGIHAMKVQKLQRIPKQVLHEMPTTLLHSLEGMPGLDWATLLALQCTDGSFLFSPSSTAYALMQTGDDNCLNYLRGVVSRFGGGVPNVYPVDLFERLWAVDRLERLGIARYFEQEIKGCLDYVHRYWTEDGISWARNSRVHDVDDTSMGFRLLRLHGYRVSPDVLRQFERKESEFVCFAGQSNQAVTGMYNMNRAAQLAFPGEEILHRARSFSHKFLREKQATNQLLDKWIITKDLPGEVEYALDFPWFASLPRVEARLYLEQYGGGGDVWIGKTLYRMPLVNNNVYLELAKADFNHCQAVHRLEWLHLHGWYEESGLRSHGVTRPSLLVDFFLAAACIFEPDRAAERSAWVLTAVLARAVSAYLGRTSCKDPTALLLDGLDRNAAIARPEGEREGERLAALLQHVVNGLASNAKSTYQLREAWKEWLLTWRRSGGESDGVGLLLAKCVEICGGRFGSTDCDQLCRLLSSISGSLRLRRKPGATSTEVEAEMQELARLVLEEPPDHSGARRQMHRLSKQAFLLVAKSLYYAAHCPAADLNEHISKVLFVSVD